MQPATHDSKAAQRQLDHELRKALQRALLEGELTYAEVCGVLDLIKEDLLANRREAMRQGKEGQK